MILWDTVPPPRISGTALHCIFSRVSTVLGLCLATNSVDLRRNLCASLLYFVVRVRRLRKESSRSLSHLMSFLSTEGYGCFERLVDCLVLAVSNKL